MNNIEIDSNVINGGWAGVCQFMALLPQVQTLVSKVRGNTFNNVGLNQGIYSQYYITGSRQFPTIYN
jgi:hypothetical protein